MAGELRFDPLTREWVSIVGHRQARPNLPDSGCPFCVGGLEAPEPYEVRWFANRWPAFDDGPTPRSRRGRGGRNVCDAGGRYYRGGAVLARPPRHTRHAGACRRCARSSTCGPRARRRSTSVTTWNTCSCSRTGAPRWAPRSRIRTARSMASASCRPCRVARPRWRTRRADAQSAPSSRPSWPTVPASCSKSDTWVAYVPFVSASRTVCAWCARHVASFPALDARGRDGLASGFARRARPLRPLVARGQRGHRRHPSAPR